MTRTIISFALLFVFLVVAQAVVFNRIWLFNAALPLVFIYFLVILPTDLNVKWLLTLGFLLGFSVDIFSDTPGLNALCCTITAALRLPILKLYVPREEDMGNTIPSPASIGRINFMKYLVSITTVYSLLFFVILSFEFFYPFRMLLRIVATSALTFIILLAFSNFMVPATSQRK